MNRILIAASLGMLFTAMPIAAQDAATPATPAPIAVAPAPAPARSLPASTMISIASDTEISSKKIEVGQKFPFFVTADIVENGIVAIPRGTRVESTVTYKTGKAVGGKSGKFELSFDKLSLSGKQYALRGTHRQEGKGNTVAAVFASLIISGRSAVMLPGQTVTAFTNEAIPY